MSKRRENAPIVLFDSGFQSYLFSVCGFDGPCHTLWRHHTTLDYETEPRTSQLFSKYMYCVFTRPGLIASNIGSIYANMIFDLGFTVRQDHFTQFERSQSLGGAKTGDPWKKKKKKKKKKKTSDHPQAELGLSHMGHELGSNPQRWDDERLRSLNVSGLNHLATWAAILRDLFSSNMNDIWIYCEGLVP